MIAKKVKNAVICVLFLTEKSDKLGFATINTFNLIKKA